MTRANLTALLLLVLPACDRPDSVAEAVTKSYSAPFRSLATGPGDCKHQVEVARELFKLEKSDHARLQREAAKLKDNVAFRSALSTRVQALHESSLATSYAKACPIEARAIGEVARQTAEALGVSDLIAPWPPADEALLLSAPRRCMLPSGVCFEYRGVAYGGVASGGDKARASCEAMAGTLREEACPRNDAWGRCLLEAGTAHEREIIDPDRDAAMAQQRCEAPVEGKQYGRWTAGTRVPTASPTVTLAAPTGNASAAPPAIGRRAPTPQTPPTAPRPPKAAPGNSEIY